MCALSVDVTGTTTLAVTKPQCEIQIFEIAYPTFDPFGVVVTPFATSSIGLLVAESYFVVTFSMDCSETRDSNSRLRRRDDAKRRGIEAAVGGLICHYGLSPDRGQRLSGGIYDLYRELVRQKSLDDQIRNYGNTQRRAEQALAVRTANASDCESDYVADAREFAARMIRLENLEKRNIGRGRAIEQAKKITWDELRPQERRKARQYILGNIHPGDKVRQPKREVKFLRSVASLIERATGHRIRFNSTAPGSHPTSRPRHHGVEFEVMTAATKMAGCRLSNEAMARLIQRLRQQ